jgi:hypothetical protein
LHPTHDAVDRSAADRASRRCGGVCGPGDDAGCAADDVHCYRLPRLFTFRADSGNSMFYPLPRDAKRLPQPQPETEIAWHQVSVEALEKARTDGGEVLHSETFAPILYVPTFDDLDEAIALKNEVPLRLSRADLHARRSAAHLAAAVNYSSDCPLGQGVHL